MTNITKRQAPLALIVAVFATAMIVGTIASSADYSASAKRVGKLLPPGNGGGNSHSQGVILSNAVSQS